MKCIEGKRSRILWGFNFGYKANVKVVESEGRTLEALSAIPRGFDQDL